MTGILRVKRLRLQLKHVVMKAAEPDKRLAPPRGELAPSLQSGHDHCVVDDDQGHHKDDDRGDEQDQLGHRHKLA